MLDQQSRGNYWKHSSQGVRFTIDGAAGEFGFGGQGGPESVVGWAVGRPEVDVDNARAGLIEEQRPHQYREILSSEGGPGPAMGRCEARWLSSPCKDLGLVISMASKCREVPLWRDSAMRRKETGREVK